MTTTEYYINIIMYDLAVVQIFEAFKFNACQVKRRKRTNEFCFRNHYKDVSSVYYDNAVEYK